MGNDNEQTTATPGVHVDATPCAAACLRCGAGKTMGGRCPNGCDG